MAAEGLALLGILARVVERRAPHADGGRRAGHAAGVEERLEVRAVATEAGAGRHAHAVESDREGVERLQAHVLLAVADGEPLGTALDQERRESVGRAAYRDDSAWLASGAKHFSPLSAVAIRGSARVAGWAASKFSAARPRPRCRVVRPRTWSQAAPLLGPGDQPGTVIGRGASRWNPGAALRRQLLEHQVPVNAERVPPKPPNASGMLSCAARALSLRGKIGRLAFCSSDAQLRSRTSRANPRASGGEALLSLGLKFTIGCLLRPPVSRASQAQAGRRAVRRACRGPRRSICSTW